MRKKFLMALFAVAGLVLMACNLLSAAKVAETVQQAAPTVAALATQAQSQGATAEPQAEASPSAQNATPGTPAKVHGALSNDSVHSFRATITVTLESALLPQSPAVIYQVTMTKAQKPQPVMHLVSKSGLPLAFDAEIYQTQDGLYSRSQENGKWMVLVGTDMKDVLGGLSDTVLAPHALLTAALSQGKPVTYQGQQMTQYRLEVNSPAMLAQMGMGEGLLPSEKGLEGARFSPKKVTIEAIARQDGLVVRQTLAAQGDLTWHEKTANATVTWQVVVQDIDADITLPLPDDLQNQTKGENAPLPLPQGAQLELSASGMTIYRIPNSSVDAVLTFWKQQGLTITSQMGDAQQGMVVTVKKANGDQIQVMLGVVQGDVKVTFMP